ncbi:uncharacterized protein LOC128763070 [Synchiropus splendidus]|uniref:uncharacterized protein LOC128763070 n=2 Tax=Synchiropus splendidus TaxID=270530 RepID=UPI00237EB162|nr:uncharacterized protein LOC128752788 isoform X1 [Synchiropus splendidus]XP_053710381.1 uncharacterized protein LOC128752788 isoform X1 [Synchiropus splendidus]XP_053727790.1 uncharacterized protein LOC128763070 [Synchiropus splendidus]
MLEQRTKLFGRCGKICGDTMQKSFLEWSYAKFEVERLSEVDQFRCPACTPSMLAVSVDGNLNLKKPLKYLCIKQRKYQLYRQADGNKRRHLLRKKISMEKRSLEDAITKYNAVVPETGKLPSPNELLAEENYSWPWECHGDMLKKKKVFDKVMLLKRLKEEEVIVVREVKQHWEYMRNMAGNIEEISSQLSERITQQSGTDALTGRGHEGLLCLLKRRLSAIQAQQGAARSTYQHVFGSQALSLDDSSTDDEEPHDSSSSTEDEEH